MYLSLEVWLPAFNTTLIGISGVFLVTGYTFIRRRQSTWHHRSMLAATVFAALFLTVYVLRAVLLETRLFAGQGLLRAFYLAILVSHTLAAIAVGPLALLTLCRAFRRQFALHRRVARLTLPLWLFVVVSGWTVYLMLYHLPR